MDQATNTKALAGGEMCYLGLVRVHGSVVPKPVISKPTFPIIIHGLERFSTVTWCHFPWTGHGQQPRSFLHRVWHLHQRHAQQ
jgi:hypothetical protein